MGVAGLVVAWAVMDLAEASPGKAVATRSTPSVEMERGGNAAATRREAFTLRDSQTRKMKRTTSSSSRMMMNMRKKQRMKVT